MDDLLRNYPMLQPGVVLRRLEFPALYDRRTDELYQLDEAGFSALSRCRGEVSAADAGLEPAFLKDCVDAGLLELHSGPRQRTARKMLHAVAPLPSLRYLEAQVTWRCNLACAHCYLAGARAVDLPPAEFGALCAEFEELGGLRLLVSGGEPLAHPRWVEVNEILAGLSVRRVLLTNGLLLDDEVLENLAADEVQVSLDGLEAGHEGLRGPGTFSRAVEAARRVAKSGRDLSAATMVHAGNLGEFEELGRLVRDLGASSWNIDAPSRAGRFGENPRLAVAASQAAEAMAHGFGDSYHGGNEGMGCGLHLLTAGADGTLAQCGFYFDRPLGTAREGLRRAWEKRVPVPLLAIEGCRDCEALADCGGGCRFRAPAENLPDEVLCRLHGIVPPDTAPSEKRR
jgi:radical SAM protein with 4Fe4S-binding SPASM domain